MTLKLSLCCLLASCAVSAGFMAPMHTPLRGPTSLRTCSAQRERGGMLNRLSMVNVPRVDLPSSVTDVLAEQELKNPNELSVEEYNSYSAAAVGGTLIFMILLGPVVGLFDLSGFVFDFAFSALLGGGALAYATLRKDDVAEYANKFGGVLMDAVGKIGVSNIPRLELPESVTSVLAEQELKNPNELSADEYNSYSAAAVGGTLIFMVLLGPVAGLFDFTGLVLDFGFSALIGGGALAYAALRKDAVAEYANKFGAVLLQGADKVAEALKK